jgi:hypothetical protein
MKCGVSYAITGFASCVSHDKKTKNVDSCKKESHYLMKLDVRVNMKNSRDYNNLLDVGRVLSDSLKGD